MNILIVTQYFWPEPFRINDFAVEMVKKGHSVTVLTGFPNYPEGKFYDNFLKDKKKYDNLQGVNIVRVPLSARGYSRISLAMNYITFFVSSITFGFIKLRNKNFDIIFVNQLSPVFVGITGFLFAKIKRKPLVMWVLDLWPESFFAVTGNKSKVLLHLFASLSKWIYSRCDVLLASSEGFLPRLKEMTDGRSPVYYFPNWAEEVFENYNAEEKGKSLQSKNTLNVMFAGNVGDAQNFEVVLAAAEILNKEKLPVCWFIVGSGSRLSWLKEQVTKRNLSHCFKFLGRRDVKQVPKLLSQADCLLIILKGDPIYSITVPGKLQSYLALGKPIIASLAGEGAAIISKTKCGFVSDPLDPRGLADNLIKMVATSLDSREEMGKNGRFAYDKNFRRDVTLSKVEKILKSVCDRNFVGI